MPLPPPAASVSDFAAAADAAAGGESARDASTLLFVRSCAGLREEGFRV